MDEIVLKKIGQRIRALRKVQGLTQERFAEKIGMSSKYFGQVERGEQNCGILNLYKIANGLSVPLKEVVDLDQDTERKEEQLRVAIMGLLAGKDEDDLRKTLKVLEVIFGE